MQRRAKPAKVSIKGKQPPARKLPKTDDGRVRDLEKCLAEAPKSKAEALEQLQTSRHDLAESQEQQTATAEILRIIRRSQANVQRSSTRLSEAP